MTPARLGRGPLNVLNEKLKSREQKFCNSCGQIKPFQDFYTRGGGKLKHTCEECSRGYDRAHSKVRALRGPALKHVCCGCGSQADQWAYGGHDPNDSGTGCNRWSEDPIFYIPLCMPCHRKLDGR